MQVLIRPVSKVVLKFLRVMQKHGYIGDFEFVDDRRAGKVRTPCEMGDAPALRGPSPRVRPLAILVFISTLISVF